MSFFPDPTRQGDIKFMFAKSLPYGTRVKAILLLLSAGITIQFFISFWLGLLLLVCATAFGLIKGYADNPALKAGDEVWAQVTPDEYTKIKLRQAQLRQWDADIFDITNPKGRGVFVAVGIACFAVGFFLFMGNQDRLATYWKWDCFVLLAPHWITGVRSFLTKDKLIIKINLLEKMMSFLAAPSDVQVLPMLSTKEAKEGGRIPMDARLMLRFVSAPDYFLGMQIQMSINSVQGTDYPYLYCVLIAKEPESFFTKKQDIIRAWKGDRRLTIEKTGSEGVDVLVIRQYTTQTSGYCTDERAARYIVDNSLQIARKLLAAP